MGESTRGNRTMSYLGCQQFGEPWLMGRIQGLVELGHGGRGLTSGRELCYSSVEGFHGPKNSKTFISQPNSRKQDVLH